MKGYIVKWANARHFRGPFRFKSISFINELKQEFSVFGLWFRILLILLYYICFESNQTSKQVSKGDQFVLFVPHLLLLLFLFLFGYYEGNTVGFDGRL